MDTRPCQFECGFVFRISFAPFDETVTVKFVEPEGTNFGSVTREFCRLCDFLETDSSVAWICGYSMPLPPTPKKRLIRGILATMRERLVTDLNTVSRPHHLENYSLGYYCQFDGITCPWLVIASSEPYTTYESDHYL